VVLSYIYSSSIYRVVPGRSSLVFVCVFLGGRVLLLVCVCVVCVVVRDVNFSSQFIPSPIIGM